MTNSSQQINVHGCAILLGRHGVLIIGESGSGKTTLCQRLIDEWISLGKFASWVCDDQVLFDTKPKCCVAVAPRQTAGLVERRFGSINAVDHQESAVIDLEVHLVPYEDIERLPEKNTSQLFESLTRIKVPERSSKTAMELIGDQLKRI